MAFAMVTIQRAFRADPALVFTTCETSIKNLPNFGTITRHDKEAGVLRCRTRRSIQSWGENISIDLEPRGALTLLHLKSEPALWTVTEDMRMNYQNVALIVRDLQRALAVESLEPAEYFSGSADSSI